MGKRTLPKVAASPKGKKGKTGIDINELSSCGFTFLLQDYFCFMEVFRMKNLWVAANECDEDANYGYKEY